MGCDVGCLESAATQIVSIHGPGRAACVDRDCRSDKRFAVAANDGTSRRLGHNTRRVSTPDGAALLLERCFTDAFRVYNMLPRPPWTDGVSWRAEQTAGYATDCAGGNVFIGADGDLLWRSWTETDHNGLSPLRAALATRFGVSRTNRKELAAAALHEPIFQRQLTTGLFEGFDTTATGVINRNSLIKCNAMDVFYYALNSPAGERRFIPEEQSRLREFIDTIELLQP